MPSTYSVSCRFELQGTGENLNTWGTRLNTALTRADKAIAGRSAIVLVGTTYTLTSLNAADDEARSAILDLSGVGGCNLVIPSVSKVYFIRNGSNGVVTVTTGAGDTVLIDATDILMVFCDGTNVETLGAGGLALKSYIAAACLAATGSLPAVAGNAGKYVYTDGVTSTWKAPATADLSDYATAIIGKQVALASVL